MMPSKKAERVYELPRLNEIAQELRGPAAVCFLQQAIATMEPSPTDDRGYVGVPEGQAKIRARISPGGEVLFTEVLESGFKDTAVPACVQQAIERKKFPPNEQGHAHYIDIIYWVSLGFQTGTDTPAFREHLRREQAEAGIRAKQCLQGRVPAGRYAVDGLNLVDREGGTMINRVEAPALPEDVRACVARAFRDIRLSREPETFVRPVRARVDFEVRDDGTIGVADEEWLRLVHLEERAKRARDRHALQGDATATVPDDAPQRPEHAPLVDELDVVDEEEAETPSSPAAEDEPPPPRRDPGQGGLRLDLGGRREAP